MAERRVCRGALGLLCVALTACRSAPEGAEQRFDLVAALPYAEIRSEPWTVDVGTPEARPLLLAGWSSAEETDPHGETFVWALGGEAQIELFLLEPRPLTLRFACRPFRFEGAPAQTLELRVGERELARLELLPKLAEYEVELPAAALRAGRNLLVLRHGWWQRPREVVAGSSDERPLAAAWHWLRLGGLAGTAPAPRSDLERGLVAVPAGVELSWFVPLAAHAALAAERIAPRGGARLEVVIEPEHGAASRLAVLEKSVERWRLELPAGAGVARLAVRVLGSGEASVALVRPEVVTVVPVAPAAAPPAASAPTARRPPDVLVYLVDTLRADHLGCYGYERGTTPAIDAFAAEALLFEQAVAQSSWTKASVASIFTGLWPRDHAANTRGDKLAAAATTLAERLHAAGWATAAFVTNPNVTESFGFDQGFEHFRYLGAITDAEGVRQEVVRWLDERDDERPLFLYVHTIDPHSPYVPHEEYRRRWAPEVVDAEAFGGKAHLDDLQAGRTPVTAAELAAVRALYDAEIAFADWSFGRFLYDWRQHGLYDTSLIALVSDHGEEFHEHGDFTHGRNLHVESLHVPLIVKLPVRGAPVRDTPGGGAPARIAAPVQHVDLLPTILAAAGLPVPAGLEGRDLVAVARGEVGERRIFSYLHLDGPARAGVRAGSWKLLPQLDGDRLAWPRLYDLAADPRERTDLAEANKVRAGFLASALRQRLAQTAAALEAEHAIVDEALRESLRALGYVQ